MTTGAARCHYALRPAERPRCQLTSTVTYGAIALCSTCDLKHGTLGKVRLAQLPDTELDPIALLTEARRHVTNAREELHAAVSHARQQHATWAAIARVLGTTRQAAQQPFTKR